MKTLVRVNLLKLAGLLKREGFSGILTRLRVRKRNDYTKWLALNEERGHDWRSHLSQAADRLKDKPLISVILPVYNPLPRWLEKTIESVREQVYGNWELCIADDASTNPDIHRILEEAKNSDRRIKVVFRKTNGHISECSNSAVAIATGDWIALLDHDDLLAPDALYEVACAINKNPEIRMIYSDEDKITGNGKRRCSPYFKPGWNRYLFYSQNLFSHLGVYHTDLVKRSGMFRKGFEGSQDYDLVLRCIEHIRDDQIYHIPKVLYHWRIHAGSTSFTAGAKPFAANSATRALQEHFGRMKIPARVEDIGYGYRTHYLLPATPPALSVIIPVSEISGSLQRLIENHFYRNAYPVSEIIIVSDKGHADNGELSRSAANSAPEIRHIGVSRLRGLSQLVNAAVNASSGEFICLFRADHEPSGKMWLHELMQFAIQTNIGVVAPKIDYPDRTTRHAGIILGMGDHGIAGFAHHGLNPGNRGYFGRAGLVSAFTAVSGTGMVFRKSCFEKINGFDEVNLPGNYADIDFCLRLSEAGYQNLYTPFSTLIYKGNPGNGFNAVRDASDVPEEVITYLKTRWGKLIQQDAAFNPNLALNQPDFSLVWPE